MRLAHSWNQRGFTAIETVVAVVIFSLIGLVMTRVFLQANQMSVNSQETERASALAEMALEQYDAYAAESYDRLPSFDQTRAAPREFFKTPDDMGYDGLTITSHAQPSADGSTTQVTVRIGWGSGIFAPTLNFTKIYPHWMSGNSGKELTETTKTDLVGM